MGGRWLPNRFDRHVDSGIGAVADVFDALAVKRPYKEAWPLESTMGLLEAGSGQHFEPRLVECFKSVLPEILDIKAKLEAQKDAPDTSGSKRN